MYIPKLFNPPIFAKGKGCTKAFGVRVDRFLQRFVEQGWLDTTYDCDRDFCESLRKDKAAIAAHCIRSKLILAGFVCTDTQIKFSAFGISPIVDLFGYDSAGGKTIVEIKCGRSAAQQCRQRYMLKPFDCFACNGYNLAMMQLALQLVCMQAVFGEVSQENRKSKNNPHNAWLATYNCSKGTTSIKKIPSNIVTKVQEVMTARVY